MDCRILSPNERSERFEHAKLMAGDNSVTVTTEHVSTDTGDDYG